MRNNWLGLVSSRSAQSRGAVANHGGKQEPVTDGWAAVRANPTLKRNPDEGCWVAVRPFPISRDGNIQFQESLGQHHCQAVIGNQPMDYRDGPSVVVVPGHFPEPSTDRRKPAGWGIEWRAVVGASACIDCGSAKSGCLLSVRASREPPDKGLVTGVAALAKSFKFRQDRTLRHLLPFGISAHRVTPLSRRISVAHLRCVYVACEVSRFVKKT